MPDPYDHKAFLAALSPARKTQLLTQSHLRGPLHLVGHLAVVAVFGAWVHMGWPLWWGAMLPLGVALVFLFTLQHECTHKTPFAWGWLNEFMGHACGVVLVLPFTSFRYFHMAHHRWTNIAGKDPELAAPRPQTTGEILLYLSGVSYWQARAKALWAEAFGGDLPDYIPRPAHGKVRAEARLLLALYALLLGVTLALTPVLLWLWVLPVIIAQPALRLYLLAEHGDCPQVTNMFENTRTTFTTALVRFLAWNMPYHAEHHIFPQVPYHNLPALHGDVRQHLKVTENGYAAFTKNYLGRGDKGDGASN